MVLIYRWPSYLQFLWWVIGPYLEVIAWLIYIEASTYHVTNFCEVRRRVVSSICRVREFMARAPPRMWTPQLTQLSKP